MTRKFYLSNTDQATSVHADSNSIEKAALTTTGADTSCWIFGSQYENTFATFTSPAGGIGYAQWPTGTYTAVFDVNYTGANASYGCRSTGGGTGSGHFARVSTSADLETKTDPQALFTGTGLKTASTGSVSWSAGNTTDLWEVRLAVFDNNPMSYLYFVELMLNAADDATSGPWGDTETTCSDSASQSDSISANKEIVISTSVPQTGLLKEIEISEGAFTPLDLAPAMWHRADLGVTPAGFWEQVVNVTTSTNNVSKTIANYAWDAGCVTGGVLQLYDDGYIEFVSDGLWVHRMIGLGTVASPSMEYGLYFLAENPPLLYIYESGTQRGGSVGSHTEGATYSVRKTGTTVTYYKNSSLLYTSLITVSKTLAGTIALHTQNSSATNVVLRGAWYQKVSVWADQSGHGLDYAQTTDGNRPVLVTTGATKIVFTEEMSTFLKQAAPTYPTTGYTIIMIAKILSTGTNHVAWTTESTQGIQIGVNSDNIALSHVAESSAYKSETTTLSRFTGFWDLATTQLSFQVNDGTPSTYDLTDEIKTSGADYMSLGGYYNGVYPISMELYEMIWVYRKLTTDEFANIRAYSLARYGDAITADQVFSPFELSPTAWYRADQGVTVTSNFWEQLLNLTASGNSVTKTSADAWDGSTVSGQMLIGEGYVEYTVGNTAKYGRFSLIPHSTKQGSNVNFGLYQDGGDGTIQVHELGSIVHDHTAISANDVLRISVSAAGAVTYKKNGTTFYTSATTATFPLALEILLYHNGDSRNNVVFSGSTGYKVTSWQDLSGNDRHAQQTSYDYARPVFEASGFNGKPSICFPGIGEVMWIAHHANLNVGTGNWFVVMVGEFLRTTNYEVWFGKGSNASADNIRVFHFPTAPRTYVYWGADAGGNYGQYSGLLTGGLKQVVGVGIVDKTHIRYISNSVLEDSQVVTPTGTGSNSLPAYIGSGEYPTRFRVSELIFLNRGTATVTNADLIKLLSYLKTRYGV